MLKQVADHVKLVLDIDRVIPHDFYQFVFKVFQEFLIFEQNWQPDEVQLPLEDHFMFHFGDVLQLLIYELLIERLLYEFFDLFEQVELLLF